MFNNYLKPTTKTGGGLSNKMENGKISVGLCVGSWLGGSHVLFVLSLERNT